MVLLSFFVSNALLPHRYEFPDDCEVIVGRDATPGAFRVSEEGAVYAVRIGSASLSETHCRIRIERGAVRVEDCGSRNGTFVRVEPGVEHPAGEHPIRMGAEVTLRVEAGRWHLPDSFESYSAESLCRMLRARLDGGAVDVRLGPPVDGSLPLIGDARHVVIAVTGSDRTLSAEDAAWARWVVSAWNAAVDARRRADRWRFTAVSPERMRALDQARRAAPTSLPLLLLGPTGCGKEVLAQDLHEHGPHRGGPFVAVNCASLAAERLESELFGHARGAFTGAHADREGLVEAASGGTLFLDEVGELPPDVQARLLRFLESAAGEYRRMGESRVRHARVRVIAATNRDLAAEVSRGAFRRDLFFRLAGVCIAIPAPAPSDIEAIARALLGDASARARIPLGQSDIDVIAARAAERAWPGGARQLRQCVERCAQTADGARGWAEQWSLAVKDEGVGAGARGGMVERRTSMSAPPAAIGRLLADALFLAAARETPNRTALSARLHITYQGADARLDALGVTLGDHDAIEARLARCVDELRAHVDESPAARVLFERIAR